MSDDTTAPEASSDPAEVESTRAGGSVAPGFDRARLVADLEAHYGRWLRATVISHYQSFATMSQSHREREAEGRGKSMLMSEVMDWMAKAEKKQYEIAIEGQAAVDMAGRIQDVKTLDVFVRWKTLPNWRKTMEAEGWTFDERHLIWTHPDHGRLL